MANESKRLELVSYDYKLVATDAPGEFLRLSLTSLGDAVTMDLDNSEVRALIGFLQSSLED